MNLQTSTLSSLVGKIGKSMYADTEELPEEEKWSIQSKLRNRSTDAISWVAEGLGSIDPRDIKWALGKARASLCVVESIYKHAADVKLLMLDPNVMLEIRQAITEINSLIDVATNGIVDWFNEMESPVMHKDTKK